MLLASHYLIEAVKKLSNILAGLKRKESAADFQKVKENTVECFADGINAAEELQKMTDSAEAGLNIFRRILKNSWEEIYTAATKDELRDALEPVISTWDESLESSIRNIEDWDISYAYRSIFSNPLIQDETLMGIGKRIIPPGREIKMLDMDLISRVSRNLSLTALSAGYNGTAELYGIDQRDFLSSAHRKVLHRVAKGDLKGAYISNNAFEVVYLCPRCSYKKDQKTIIRNELRLLYKALDLLQPGGILIYAVPVNHLYREVCSIFAARFGNVRVEACDEFAVVTAVKRESVGSAVEENRETYEKLRFFSISGNGEKDTEPQELSLEKTKSVPLKFFRGSLIDESELELLYENSKAVKDFWEGQKVEKHSENGKRPLLPFNVGQLGLILTSGCLDGIVQEDEYCAHAVKGRIIKKQEQVTDVNESGRQLTVSVTTSNRVEINAFLPDGTYLNLA